jgi:DNA-binding transcriptional MerR regulator
VTSPSATEPASPTPSIELTIDELAQRSGVSVRNIRNYQSKGLLEPPRLRGRTGYYGAQHLERLALIGELQSAGMTLKSMKWMLDAGLAGDRQMLEFHRAARTPFEAEQPLPITPAQIAERWSADPELAQRAIAAGVLRVRDDGQWELPSPTLWRASMELLDQGIPAEQVIEIAERLSASSAAVADSFVSVFRETFWDPFVASDRPAEEWERLHRIQQRLQPLAAEAMLAAFNIAMLDAIERVLEEQPPG